MEVVCSQLCVEKARPLTECVFLRGCVVFRRAMRRWCQCGQLCVEKAKLLTVCVFTWLRCVQEGDVEVVCGQLWCRDPNERHGACRTNSYLTALPGTPCSQGKVSSQRPVQSPQRPILSPQRPVQSPQRPILSSQRPVPSPQRPVQPLQRPVTTTSHPVTTTSRPVPSPQHPVTITSHHHNVPSPQCPVPQAFQTCPPTLTPPSPHAHKLKSFLMRT